MSTAPPPLPPRQPQHPPNDDPPPAYTPAPADPSSCLQVGPQYPFGPSQPTHPEYQQQQQYHPPQNQQYHPQQNQHDHYQQQQQHYPQQQYNGFQPPPPSNPNPFTAVSEPTSVPTPGRPLLYEERILVYPHLNGTTYFCPKCCNTGFKGFDPSRPCRKCWQKYGKPWAVVRVSPMSNSGAWALQRPLPPAEMALSPPPLVVQPGDPRIGGRLCLNCNGSGQKTEELTLINVFLGGGGQEVCTSCRGTGRVFF